MILVATGLMLSGILLRVYGKSETSFTIGWVMMVAGIILAVWIVAHA